MTVLIYKHIINLPKEKRRQATQRLGLRDWKLLKAIARAKK